MLHPKSSKQIELLKFPLHNLGSLVKILFGARTQRGHFNKLCLVGIIFLQFSGEQICPLTYCSFSSNGNCTVKHSETNNIIFEQAVCL